jgi:CRISPR-associated protein Csb1
MATAVQVSEFSTKHKPLDPDGPVCLIIQAQMDIAAGLDRFQPAGFPEVGHVIYDAPRSDGRSEKVCIVDSPASMANHLEQVCLAGENDPDLNPDLVGLPYVKCVTDRNPTIKGGSVTLKPDDPRNCVITTSLTEGHRIASDYFLDARRLGNGNQHDEASFRDVLRKEFQIIEVKKDKTYFIPPEAWWSIYRTLFKYDPNSLVHGVLFAKEQIKISRMLTAHLEAIGAARVGRSGVKFDRLGKTTSGQPIFAVNEETAREIRATFIIDLALLRSYGREVQEKQTALALTGSPEEALGVVPQCSRPREEPLGLTRPQKELLLAFALWKIQALLSTTFSYRSGCKLRMQKLSITTDGQQDGDKPLLTELPVIDMQSAITAATFPAEPITRVYYPYDALFKLGEDKSAISAEEESEEEGSEGESED